MHLVPSFIKFEMGMGGFLRKWRMYFRNGSKLGLKWVNEFGLDRFRPKQGLNR